MPVIPFGEYRPDVSDYQAGTEQGILNVVPRADGFGPVPSLAAISAALGSQCLGAFEANKSDGSAVVFAGTSTDLYLLDNTAFTWSKVSISGGYSAVSSGELWQFVQFNSLVIAVQGNAVPQVFNVASDTLFSNLAGSPPQSRYIAVVGRFVVLSGLVSTPNAIQWSGLNDVNGTNSWTPGINSADLQTFPDGGFVRGVTGIGQSGGIIFQDSIIRQMTYLPGDPRVFDLSQKLAEGLGIYGPYSLVKAGSTVLFFSLKGFQKIDGNGLTPIGRERVDRTFYADLDVSNLGLFMGVSDPRSSRVLWVYKSVNGVAGQFDKGEIYDTVLDKFTPVRFSGEFLFSIAQPGLTLEALDAFLPGAMNVTGAANNGSGLIRIAVTSTAALSGRTYISIQNTVGTTEANGNWFFTLIDGTHIDLIGSAFVHTYVSGGLIGGSLDALNGSLDDFPAASVPELAAFDASHLLNFFHGPNLEATLQTAEQGTDGARIKEKKGVRPITDSPLVLSSASARENLQQTAAFGTESGLNPVGICNMIVDTRYSRFKCRIPAGTVWTFINGIEPASLSAGGKR